MLAHREVVDDEDQGAGVFAHALADGAIGVPAGEVGEHSGAFDEADVAAATGYLMAECFVRHGFPDADGPVEDVREAFGLGDDTPIRNVTRMIERAGIAVAPLSVPVGKETLLEGHCGMSRWDENAARACIMFITGMSGDRQRFTLAHELAHALLHTRRRVEGLDDREREADRFAGALFLPAPVAEAEISESVTLQGYMRIKARYGISLQGAITRGQRLGLISRDRQRSLMIQISSRGWRTAEPVRVGSESPMLLWTELTAAHGANPYFRASTALGIAPRLLEDWIPPRDPRPGNDDNKVVSLNQRRA